MQAFLRFYWHISTKIIFFDFFLQNRLTNLFECDIIICVGYLGVAQIGSALPWGGRGRRFKSCHSDQSKGFVVRNRAFYFFPYAHEHLKTSKGFSGYFVLKTGIFSNLDAYKLGVHSFLPDFQIIFILKYRCNKSALQICCQQMLSIFGYMQINIAGRFNVSVS